MKAVPRLPQYTQVCVWPGTSVGNSDRDRDVFRFGMNKMFGVRVQYLEEVITSPDKDAHGLSISGTGGRTDLIFAVHSEDVSKFAVPRLAHNIRWVEDVMSMDNKSWMLYPAYVDHYCAW